MVLQQFIYIFLQRKKNRKRTKANAESGGESAIQVRQMRTGLPMVRHYAAEGGVRALRLVCEQRYLVACIEDGKLLLIECNL